MPTKTASFVLELPLRVDSAQEKRLLARLEAARQVYNACLGESLQRLRLMRQSKQYQAAKKLPKGKQGTGRAKVRACAFREANAYFAFREYDLHAYAGQFNHSWLGDHLDINTIQKLATRAYKASQQYAFGRRGRPRFKGRQQMDSVEGKSNASGIRWREEHVAWLGMKLEAIIEAGDPVVAHGLASRVKFVRLVRRKLSDRNRFYVQLVCEGKPYQKPKNAPGKGVVGLDIGPSTIAVVGEGEAFLEQFCADLEDRQREIRRLQRKIDRQRRANNPQNYPVPALGRCHPNGTAKRGPKRWRKSRRQRRTETKHREIKRKQAAHRKSQHGQMVNRVLRMGDTIKTEKLSYRAFQRAFGRSVGMRAPGMFVAQLRRKAVSAGATVVEFSTHTTRLSQVCHSCGRVEKKPLSQRWHRCDCGINAQRDLYSAFLATCVEDERLNVDRARVAWSGVDTRLQTALSDAYMRQPANGRAAPRRVPSSFGLSRRQSRSSAISGPNEVKAQDVVPSFAIPGQGRESLRETSGAIRTPRLQAWGVSDPDDKIVA